MTCVVNFVFALSQLQGVEWGRPGRREPYDEHSPASKGGGSFLFVYFIFTCIGIPIYVVYFACDSASGLHFLFWGFPTVGLSLGPFYFHFIFLYLILG